MALFLLLILAAVGLGIAGAVVKGLFCLLVIGVLVFLCAFVVPGFRLRCPPPAR